MKNNRITYRKALYASLAKRGLSQKNAETLSAKGTLYDNFYQFCRNPQRYQSGNIAYMANKWFQRALLIYDDDTFPHKPSNEWKEFLIFLKQLSLYPSRFSNDFVAHKLTDAMQAFSTELTAIKGV